MALTIPVAEIVESSRNPLLGKHESWGRVLLGEIATIQNGFPFKSTQFTKSEGMPLIRIRDVGADCTDTNYVGDYDPAFVVKAGDLLIGMDGDFNCARWRGPDGLLNQRVCRVILKSDIYHPKLLDYALPGYLKAINDMTSSVTVKHLSSKSIAEIPLPLPPMEQQKRIVAEIEKQFSRLDEAIAYLKRVKANLKRYKAAVLKAAVEGRLVETEAARARREGRSYETGEQLLQRILETRRSQWQGKGKYKEPAAPDTSNLPELPEGWVWATIGQATECLDSMRVPVNKKERLKRVGDIPYYGANGRVGYIDDYIFDEPLVLVVEDETFTGRELPFSYKITGKSWVNNHAHVLRPSGMVTVEYLNYSLSFYPFTPLTTGTTGRKKLTQLALVTAPLCVPPLHEQQRIVSEVDRRMSLVEEVEDQVNANLMRAGRLRQAVLSGALAGRIDQKNGVSHQPDPALMEGAI